MSASHNEGPDDMDSGSAAAEQSETRMREALNRLSGGDRPVTERPSGDRFGGSPRPPPQQPGSFSSAGPRRHRYVQDGEVPVVQISSMRDRRREPVPGQASPEPPADHMRVLLGQERAARQRVEQLLEKAQATLHGLETRLGHAEITQREAVEQARTHEAEVVRLRARVAEMADQLEEERLQAAAALQRQHELESELEEARSDFVAEPVFEPQPPPLLARNVKPPARRGRPPARIEAPVIEVEEPEPVKWWLTPAPKAKARRSG